MKDPNTKNEATGRAKASTLTNAGRIAGAIGAVMLVSLPFTWLLTEEFGLYIWGKLAAGLLLCGFYLATNAGFLGRVTGSRSTGLWALSAVAVVIVVGIVGVINYLAVKHDREFDMTREGLYTLSPQSETVLSRLSTDVQILAFYASEEDDFYTVQDTLERYARASKKVSFQLINPQERPDLVEKYGITEGGSRIVVLAGDKEARAKDASEMELTNAIVRVAAQTAKTVAFLKGHGEPSIEDGETAEGYKAVADAIRAEGYDVEAISLLSSESAGTTPGKIKITEGDSQAPHPDDAKEGLQVPSRVTVLVIAGARSMLLEPEIAAIQAFLERGGRVLLFVDPHVNIGVSKWLEGWKIALHDDMIVDANVVNRLLGLGPAAPMVYAVDEDDPIAKGLQTAAVMFTARSLAVAPTDAPRIEAHAFLTTDESAWGETNPVDGMAERGSDDNAGPVDVAVVATMNVPAHVAERVSDEARLVVFGDSDWLSNRYLPLQGNTNLLVNTVNWAASEEDRISIGRKTRESSQVFFTLGQLGVLKFVTLDLLWVLYVAVGLGVVLVRRQK